MKTSIGGATEKRPNVEQVIEMRPPVFTDPANPGLLADIYESPSRDAYVILIPVPGLKPDELSLKQTLTA